MSRINDLIQDLCPNGVHQRPLRDVAAYSKTRVDASKLDAGTFVGVDNLVADKRGRVDAAYLPNTSRLAAFEPGDILLGNIRPYLKKVWLSDRAGGCSGDVLALRLKKALSDNLRPQFLYYVLSSDSFFVYNMKHARGAKMPRGSRPHILEYPVPVPPVEVQDEIVRILDTFSALTAELEAELEARRLQFQYYRDTLLGFQNVADARWVPLGELGKFYRGRRFTKKDFARQGIRCIHYGEIYTHYGTSTKTTRSALRLDITTNLRFAQPGDVIVVDVGEEVDQVGKAVAWLGEAPVAIHDHSYAFRHELNPAYVSYCMQTDWFTRAKRRHIARAKVKTLLISGFSQIKIPVVPPSEQDHIVNTLARMEALLWGAEEGIQVEIEARRKQREYYRNKLLSFSEAGT